MDDETRVIVESFQRFMDEAVESVRGQSNDVNSRSLRRRVSEHLGHAPESSTVVRMAVDPHLFVNLDLALEAMMQSHGGGEVVGISGDQRHHIGFGDMISEPIRPWQEIATGSVDRTRMDTGPDSSREVIALGVRLMRYNGSPVAVLQRTINPQYGGDFAGIELVSPDDVSEPMMAELRQLMDDLSVFRGQVLTFAQGDPMMHHQGIGMLSFLPRPSLPADSIVLPDGVLQRLDRHILGAGRQRDRLLAAKQHLKRGLLLYGPPGTGKTHTVRYLISQATDITCITLAGPSLQMVGSAATLAQALQPAMVVLEDVDLIAEHREFHTGGQPFLFSLLDAMDGLTSAADVAFVLTTNRADLLEEALAQRPGRVDLAIEIPLPDTSERLALLQLYAGSLGLAESALRDAADRTQGCTASFFKELARRAVLMAAESDQDVDAASFAAALTEMLDDSERLTLALLGSAPNH